MTKTQKKFAVFDIDGTLVRWQLYHAITDKLGKLGYLPEGSLERLHKSRMEWKNRNSIDAYHRYETEMVTVFQDALTNIPVEAYHAAVSAVFASYKDQVYTYTRGLIVELKRAGYLIFAISGSPQDVLEKIGSHYGFDDVVGPSYEQKDGSFTGQITLTHTRKGEILQELVTKHGATWRGSIAVGDSPSDIAMLELVEKPITFNPTGDLYELALQKGWPIIVERKNVVYELKPRNGTYILEEKTRG
jgi:HAD superfamily hydrolase (TIGR01490 family)